MTRAFVTLAVFLAGVSTVSAQTTCYPRIAAYSGQYEGACPDPALRWTVVENTIGAYGRNCSGEPWTYNRMEKMFYNSRANESFAMQDCYAPSRDQGAGGPKASLSSDAVRRFHETRIRRPGTSQEVSARP